MIPKHISLAAWVVSGIVTLSIIGGLIVVGSPFEARKVTADQQRSSDLSSLVQIVRSYYGDQKKLPLKLSDCRNENQSVDTITDPRTGQPYEYRAVSKDHFEICAIFETDTTKKRVGYGYAGGDNFDSHPAGRVCFIRPAKTSGN